MDAQVKIMQFRDEHGYLSNFWPCEFSWNGHKWPTSEHAYQWAKVPTEEWYEDIMECTAGQAKRRAAKLDPRTKRVNWDEIKINIMTSILLEKFKQNEELLQKLLNTGEAEIVEGNDWGDTYWGQCQDSYGNWHGENQLGKVLMFVRDYYRDQV